jgi:hypothetical protein
MYIIFKFHIFFVSNKNFNRLINILFIYFFFVSLLSLFYFILFILFYFIYFNVNLYFTFDLKIYYVIIFFDINKLKIKMIILHLIK